VLAKISVCVCLALSISSCASLQMDKAASPLSNSGVDSQAAEDFAARLLPVAALPDDLLMQQRVTVRWQDRKESFEAVLQKRGSELLLLGLGPMNTVGFKLILDDRGVSFENRSGRAMLLEPERILADVQRVFYPWIEPSSDCFNCERAGIRAGVEILERIGSKSLEERRFGLPGSPERGEIVVRYERWREDRLAPSRAVLTNGWFGYELIIETMHVERIE
jgi:hypothetical protein